MPHEEPHIVRRRAILKKYPQIKELYKKDPISAYLAIIVTSIQLCIAYFIQNTSWPIYLSTIYVFGASLNHTMFALLHDLTHYTAFENININRFMAFITNITSCIPSAMAFTHYHREHHLDQGNPQRDADLPTQWEINTFNTPIRKIFFLFFHILFYAIRPLYINPKGINMPDILNFAFIMSTDYLIYTYIGPYALLYLLLSGFFALGLHPLAMHIIAEHYEFVKGQETYNYFGISNFFNLNLGYHTEHHDFPMVPWRSLPKIRKIAPEFYQDLPFHTSYLKVAIQYIFDNEIGPYSRIDTTNLKIKKQ
ncbi:hypothetical protein IMG5_127390 [Ichthyophthirius multifiliis]|uniref:Sphingolipid delta4-desaturase N-terminal domain-containing protein n=1 Tax=Ichthyophthirius multifiliis TaxID=5932 RepID=G0QVX0_ICHMU|nr:hypothetical protein IMG5_127390 [Ichthyophthirius multifiliis]EGR30635.1 hypothetical protein IMG5_127390 [Ichthyophthirius multifiliis]|eukprot:XP_004032222.1 hypothetical protein IMG5_127390 [Ichthyophthirius multifiliis]